MTLPRCNPESIRKARELASRHPVYVDTETTGIDAGARIVEIAVVDDTGAILVNSLVKPPRKIPKDSTRIHGITDEMVADAPTWPEVWPLVMKALTGRAVGMYNADFDLRMMKMENRHNWLPWDLRDEDSFCIMRLYAQFYGEWDIHWRNFRFHRLEDVGRHCHIDIPNSHQALDDARLAGAVLRYMAEYGS